MKKLIYLILGVTLIVVCGASITSMSQVDGVILHSVQSYWVIAESENSAETQTDALGVTERTKKIVDALIKANANEEAYISVLRIPAKWNALRFRNIGITDGATATHQIYLGTLGGKLDCELSYAGQLAWTMGTQKSIYDQIAFTSGGTYEPQIDDTVTGNTSGETAVIVSIVESASTWSAGTAAGTITYRSASGAFTNSETISIKRANKVLASNAYTHAASDLIDFEFADTLVITDKAWSPSVGGTTAWASVSPADNTNAEGVIDVKGADFMVIVTTVSSVDSKLLVRGY